MIGIYFVSLILYLLVNVETIAVLPDNGNCRLPNATEILSQIELLEGSEGNDSPITIIAGPFVPSSRGFKRIISGALCYNTILFC